MSILSIIWGALTKPDEEDLSVVETLALFWGRRDGHNVCSFRQVMGNQQLLRLLGQVPDAWTRLEILERTSQRLAQTQPLLTVQLLVQAVRGEMVSRRRKTRRTNGGSASLPACSLTTGTDCSTSALRRTTRLQDAYHMPSRPGQKKPGACVQPLPPHRATEDDK